MQRWLLILLILLLGGCSTQAQEFWGWTGWHDALFPPDVECPGCAPTTIEIRQFERVPKRAIDPSSLQDFGVSQVNVWHATSVEVPEVAPRGGVGGGGIPMGPPGLAVLLLGGVLEGLAEAGEAIRIEQQLGKALTAFDFSKRLQKSIKGRLHEYGQSKKRNADLDIVIQRYGFSIVRGGARSKPADHESFCTVIDAQIILRFPGQVIWEDKIFWEPFKRSMDVPPPRCASPFVLAAEREKLARQILEEATENLAEVIVERLK